MASTTLIRAHNIASYSTKSAIPALSLVITALSSGYQPLSTLPVASFHQAQLVRVRFSTPETAMICQVLRALTFPNHEVLKSDFVSTNMRTLYLLPSWSFNGNSFGPSSNSFASRFHAYRLTRTAQTVLSRVCRLPLTILSWYHACLLFDVNHLPSCLNSIQSASRLIDHRSNLLLSPSTRRLNNQILIKLSWRYDIGRWPYGYSLKRKAGKSRFYLLD